MQVALARAATARSRLSQARHDQQQVQHCLPDLRLFNVKHLWQMQSITPCINPAVYNRQRPGCVLHCVCYPSSLACNYQQHCLLLPAAVRTFECSHLLGSILQGHHERLQEQSCWTGSSESCHDSVAAVLHAITGAATAVWWRWLSIGQGCSDSAVYHV